MKIQENLKEYGRFLEKQEETKQLMKHQLMTSNLNLITSVMLKSGWVKKGRGNVTDTMVKTNTFSCDYLKNFNGLGIRVTIRCNIGDDYIDSRNGGGINYFTLRDSGKPRPYRWNGEGGRDMVIHIEFNENEDRKDFHLQTHLQTVDELFK